MELRARGMSFVPVIGKRHAFPWEPYTERFPTVSEIASWFTGAYDSLAIVTGRISGVVAIDCDSPEAIHFADGHFTRTSMRTRTPRGGEHRYYRCTDLVGNRIGLFGLPLDLRGERGICVAVGTGYERAGDWSADIPAFNRDWLPSRPPPVVTLPAGGSDLDRLRRYIRRIASVSGEHGHNSCYRCACRISDSGLAFEQALAELIAWNEECAFPKWSLRELEHKLIDAFRRKDKRC